MSMDRDEALKQAMHYARSEQAVAVIWHYPERPAMWVWSDYHATELLDAIDIRYVLPNGEVTKLS